jgi:anti-sigma regulatory factor (Ser/Thr protein kinase)
VTSDPPLIHLRLPAVRESLPLIRHVIATLVAAQALPSRRQEQVLLAVATAAADAVRHAARDLPPPGEIEIEGRVGGGRLVITVTEDFAPLIGTGDICAGLALIGAVADRIELGASSDGGAATRMSFSLGGGG